MSGRDLGREPGAAGALGDLQATYDVIVVGAGLAGLFAGALAAERGARTLVLAHGVGGTHLGPGTIDVWGYRPDGAIAENPAAEVERLRGTQHPLALAGTAALSAALDELARLCAARDYPLAGRLDHNHVLPTALGAPRPTCLAPESFVKGELTVPGEMTLAELSGFRDFYAGFAAANVTRAGHTARAAALPLPRMPMRRDLFPSDLGRLFDQASFRAEAIRLWQPLLKGVTRLGLPGVIGYLTPRTAWRDLSESLGADIFEIPLVPPSVPGMRLFNILLGAVEAAGGRVTIGPKVTGWFEADSARPGQAAGVIADTAGGPRRYAARHVILATGGFRHGGLEAPALGAAHESVFDLPVVTEEDWYAPLYWDPQPYARFGVRVNAQMQPVDADGAAVYTNVYAVGGLLAGADRLSEGSREGIDLATAWKAVDGLPLARAEGMRTHEA